MTDLIIATTMRETIADIAQAICIVWQSEADTPAVYAEHCRVHNADLRHSVIAHAPDGQLVGIGVLCRRGDRGFVLDFGIAPKFRGRGWGHRLFAALMKEAQAAHLHEVSLLVDADNKPAIRIYQRAGFEHVRELVTLLGKPAAYAPGSARELRNGMAQAIIAWFGAGKSTHPQWERDLPSLLSMADVRAFENARGFLLARPSPYHRRVDIVHLGLQPDAVTEDVNALLYVASVAFGADLPLALPEEPRDSRPHRLLHDLGFRAVDHTFEMRKKM